jgi:hypothetical protein
MGDFICNLIFVLVVFDYMSYKKRWEMFSDEQLIDFVNSSYSFRSLAEKCGYAKSGGSGIAAVINMSIEKGFDTSHFSNTLREEDVKINDVFIYGYKSREVLKRNLVVLRGHSCECCGLQEWNGAKIPLQVHHVNGDCINNTLENLQLLCPNCHAQTDTYCRKNTKKSISDEELIEALRSNYNIRQALLSVGITDGRCYERARRLLCDGVELKKQEIVKSSKDKHCLLCGKNISQTATYCAKCVHYAKTGSIKLSREELKELIRSESFLSIGKKFGVSDNTIRKWCRSYGLPYKKSEIRTISDVQWGLI